MKLESTTCCERVTIETADQKGHLNEGCPSHSSLMEGSLKGSTDNQMAMDFTPLPTPLVFHLKPDHHLPLPLPLLPLAQIIPSHILIDIFSEVVRLQEHEDPETGELISEAMHGGGLVEWDSHEPIRHMALVCRSWEDSARFVLYRSVAILSAVSAELFLRTAQKRPQLAQRTSFLVLGLGKLREDTPAEDERHLSESLRLVKVLAVTSNLRHLQLRPLHREARPSLLLALASLELASFGHIARSQKSRWIQGVLQPSDLGILLTPTLQKLELDFDTSIESDYNFTPIFPTTSITSLRLQVDYPLDQVLAIVASCASTLQRLDLYLESSFSPQQVLIPSGPSLRSLSIITNPGTGLALFESQLSRPFIDVLLPYLIKLEHLRISASDISLTALSTLPSSLRPLCIHTCGVEVLASPLILSEAIQRIPLGSPLQTLCIHDTLDVWDENEVEEMSAACGERGILFALSDSLDCEANMV